ncbi:MORN repeat protein [Maribacter spongiicola]|uniref:MORN repeat protein n=1 Tax=Maribacter spongiicola TaxID=1206753 RepID=A0A4R7K0J7_9FLAO|nr:hypothetical protein [Maribacter spongiicola]TDT43834.1 MORN repeat protein [Maribacter spongiicola]
MGTTNIPISGRYGKWLFYSEETGKIEQKCEFENGMRSGQLIAYHPNGQIEAKGTFKNDEFDGIFETFDESGKLKSKEVWENGKKISSE